MSTLYEAISGGRKMPDPEPGSFAERFPLTAKLLSKAVRAGILSFGDACDLMDDLMEEGLG